MTLPLRGRRIVVTRPRAQAAWLLAAIAEQGGEALPFPLLEISPATDPTPLQVAIAGLDSYSLAIFISPNAVTFSLPALLAQRQWPATLRPLAIGPGTVTALAGYGISNTLAPQERFDSEALLELPELQPACVAGQRVLILRGNGGRELLADTLRERGAAVEPVTCYQRRAPSDAGPLPELWRRGQLDALTISSSEGLRNLWALLDEPARQCLRATPVFVPHRRIAELARSLGLQQVVPTGPADAGIMAALGAFAWPRR